MDGRVLLLRVIRSWLLAGYSGIRVSAGSSGFCVHFRSRKLEEGDCRLG
jgi:hypothetical protein